MSFDFLLRSNFYIFCTGFTFSSYKPECFRVQVKGSTVQLYYSHARNKNPKGRKQMTFSFSCVLSFSSLIIFVFAFSTFLSFLYSSTFRVFTTLPEFWKLKKNPRNVFIVSFFITIVSKYRLNNKERQLGCNVCCVVLLHSASTRNHKHTNFSRQLLLCFCTYATIKKI